MTYEEARLTLQENLSLMQFEHPRIGEAVKVVLEVLMEYSPTDLDRAAKNYAILPMDVGDGKVCIDKTKESTFKDGAYWAICQGEYVDGEVVSTSTDDWECIRIFKKLHTSGDKIRVKIINP